MQFTARIKTVIDYFIRASILTKKMLGDSFMGLVL